MRSFALVLALLVLAGCWRGMPERPPLGGRGGGGVTPSGSASGGTVGQKTVTAKHDPSTLVAFDGTKCVVTESRYRETVVGEKAWCVWQ